MTNDTPAPTTFHNGSSWETDEAKTVRDYDADDGNYAAAIVESADGESVFIIAGVPEEDTAFTIRLTLAQWDAMLLALHDKNMLTT